MTDVPPLDAVDHELLHALERNSRRTLADLGEQVGLSAPATKRRIDRLERLGVITGYTAVIDHAKLGWSLEALVELRMVGNARLGQIEEAARDIPEVQQVFTTAGDPDAVVRLRARDVAHLRRSVDRLRGGGRVTGTKTLLVLGAWSQAERSTGPRPRAGDDR
jgi:Lrp/AsnC family leucine-responsive transcriptional regulator